MKLFRPIIGTAILLCLPLLMISQSKQVNKFISNNTNELNSISNPINSEFDRVINPNEIIVVSTDSVYKPEMISITNSDKRVSHLISKDGMIINPVPSYMKLGKFKDIDGVTNFSSLSPDNIDFVEIDGKVYYRLYVSSSQLTKYLTESIIDFDTYPGFILLEIKDDINKIAQKYLNNGADSIRVINDNNIRIFKDYKKLDPNDSYESMHISDKNYKGYFNYVRLEPAMYLPIKNPYPSGLMEVKANRSTNSRHFIKENGDIDAIFTIRPTAIPILPEGQLSLDVLNDAQRNDLKWVELPACYPVPMPKQTKDVYPVEIDETYYGHSVYCTNDESYPYVWICSSFANYLGTIGSMEDDDSWSSDEHNYNRIHDKFVISTIPDDATITGAEYQTFLPDVAPFTTGDCDGLLDWEEVCPESKQMVNNMTSAHDIYTDGSVDTYSNYWYNDVEDGSVYYVGSGWEWDRADGYTGFDDVDYNATGLLDVQSRLAGDWYVVGIADKDENNQSPTYWQAVATHNWLSSFRVSYIPCCTAPDNVVAYANGASSTTVCPGANVNLTFNGSTGGGCACGTWRYGWYNGSSWWNGTGFASGTPVYNSSYASINTSVTINTTYTFRMECSYCGTYKETTVQVNAFSNSTAASSVSGTGAICPGDNQVLTVSGGSLGTNANWTWYTGSCGGTQVGNGSSITVSPASATTYYVRAEGLCNTSPCVSGAITLNTQSAPATSASASPATIPVGGNSSLSIFGGTLGTGGVWRWYTGSCGGTLVGTGTSINVTPTVNTTYYIRAEGDCNNTTCVSVTVYVEGSVTICKGKSATLSISTGTLGTGATWEWYSGSCIAGTYVGTGTSVTVAPTVTTTYYVKGDGNCNTTGCASMQVIVNTLSDITGAAISATNPNICSGGSSTISVSGGTIGTGASWQWYSGTCGGTFIGSGTSININPTTTTTYFARLEGNCNNTTCLSQTITVAPDPVASISSSTNLICTGGSVPFTQTCSGGSGTFTDQWQTSSNGTTWSNWTTSENPSYSNLTSSTFFRCVRSATNNGCDNGVSNVIYVTVVTDPTISSQPTSPVPICVGGTSENITTTAADGTGSFSYQWQYNNSGSWGNVANGTPGGSVYTGATGSTFSVAGISTAGSYEYRCNISQSGGGCGQLTTNTVIVTVEPDPSVTIVGAATICSGGDATLLASETGGTGTFAYQWQSSPDGSSWSNIGGATNATYTTPSLASTVYYHAIVSASGSGCNSATSNSQAITIFPDPSISTHPAGATICEGDTHAMSVTASGGTPSLTYQWQNSSDGSTWADISGAESSNYTTPALSSTTYYRVIVDAGGSACDAIISNPATVVIDATSDGGAVSADPSTAICAGQSAELSLTLYTGSIQWQTNASGSWANIGSATSNTFNTPELTATTSYRAIVTNGVCASNNSNIIVISVTTPDLTGIFGNDYIWTGATSATWDGSTINNWLKFISGSVFEIPASVPNNNDNVFIRSTGTCFATPPVVNAINVAECNNLTIDLGNILNINAGSNLKILGDLINDGTLNITGTSPIEINGDWNNSGTFNAGSGTVYFVGSTQQILTTIGETFNNVEINNTSGNNAAILLNNDLRIGGQLTLTNGIVSFANPIRKLILENSATTNAGNTNSFVDGIVEKTACNSNITLPTGHVNSRDIGSGLQTYKIWAPIGLSPIASTTVNARYLFSNEGLNQWWYHDWTHEAPLTHTSSREYWIVNSGQNLHATLNWRNNSPCAIHDFCEPGPVFNSGDLTIAYWNGIWKDAGGTASPNYIDGSITSSALVLFGAKGERQITFGAKNEDMPLPIELTSFNAICENHSAIINWETASETNNDFFIVEKSNDMVNFFEITRVDGAGNSNSLLSYSISDNELFSGDNYYRLKQIDFDGKSSTSNTISINCDRSNEEAVLIAYPNPFNEELNVTIENLKDKEFVLEIIDDLGRVVYSENFTTVGSNFIATINLKNIKPAVYTLRTLGESTVLNTKIVKK